MPKNPTNKIVPRANAPESLAVNDGQTCIGHIVASGGSYFAFDADNILFGEFATQREALRALPAANKAKPT
jgi:hypothetical protein